MTGPRQTSGDMPDAAAIARAAARSAGLRYVNDRMPGIHRKKSGKGFRYVDADGKPVRDEASLARIQALVLPPAWRDVWIAAQANGHLQATGIDARGRKQYRYHAQWRQRRDVDKFAHMIEFGELLPKLRRRVRRDLALRGLPRDKVLATIVALLDSTLARIGNVEYARENRSYGLTTLRDRHAHFARNGGAFLQFRGKGGVEHEVRIDDRRLARIVRRCRDIPGQHLFQYLDDDGKRHEVDSGMVNDYLRDALGAGQDAPFTAKDFRTWGATLRAIALMGCTPHPDPCSERAITSCIAQAVKQVAGELGNTPAVCRKSYINPIVFDAWRNGSLHEVVSEDVSRAPRKAERLALDFLKAQRACR